MREGGRAVGVLGVRVGELLRRGVPGEGVEGAQEGVPCCVGVIVGVARFVVVLVGRIDSPVSLTCVC